jgi:hypothetical protein
MLDSYATRPPQLRRSDADTRRARDADADPGTVRGGRSPRHRRQARIESSSDFPFDGLVIHAAGEGPNGFFIFDVFESEQAVERFREALGTIPEEVGIEEPPRFFPAHTVFVRDEPLLRRS